MCLELNAVTHAVDKIKLRIFNTFNYNIDHRVFSLTIDFYNKKDIPDSHFEERINDIKIQITQSEVEFTKIINGHKFDMPVETELHFYLQQHKEKQLNKINVFVKLFNNNHG